MILIDETAIYNIILYCRRHFIWCPNLQKLAN